MRHARKTQKLDDANEKYLVSNTKLHNFSPYHVLQLQVDSLLVTLGVRVIG